MMIVLFEGEERQTRIKEYNSLCIQIIDSCRTDVDSSRDMQLFLLPGNIHAHDQCAEGLNRVSFMRIRPKKERSK